MKHDLGWEALADRRQLSRVILFYKIHHNLVLIPIPDYLTLNPRPNRNRHHLCYNIPSVNKDCLKFSFFVRVTRDCNLVHPALMSHTSLNSFRANITNPHIMICFILFFMLCLFFSFLFIFILPVNFLFIIIIIFPLFLFFSHTSCTLFPTNKPPHPQCRRIILEYEGALYRVEYEVS